MLALAETFNVEVALTQIETLTGPPYLGRRAASAGGLAAGDYIAGQFAQFRLQPAGDDGTFFQTFPVSYTNLAETPQLAVTLPDGDTKAYELYEAFAPVIRDFVGEGIGSGKVVWMNACSHDDFGQLDATDKIVLCRPGLSGSSIQAASREAVEHGAGGLLLVTDPEQRPPDFGNRFTHAWIPEPIPAMRVFPYLVDDLFIGSSATITDFIALKEPALLATQVEMTVDTLGYHACPSVQCLARNVLGVLPGRDPEFADEIVVISAHYDHLGESPDGTAWVGANDDASGVAVLLEIARNWQEQGYVPRRTVLFAAWDAEELGLLGSSAFVQHPQYPPENIVAVLQLDMVRSGGDVLYVDGADELAAEIQTVGEALEIPMGRIPLGRSDHAPFLNAGVPAMLLIWLDEEGNTPAHYHRPADTLEVIELDKLAAVGELAATAVLNLAESEPAIMEMLATRATAVTENNLAAFLGTSQADQTAVDTFWFNDIQSIHPITASIEIANLQVTGDTATGNVQLSAHYPVTGDANGLLTASGSLSVQFTRHNDGWQWAGPNLAWLEESGVKVGYPANIDADLTGLGDLARSQYRQIANALGLDGETAVTLQLLPDTGAIRASAALSLPEEQEIWISSSIVKLAYSRGITESVQLTDALTQLALANAGVVETDVPWLWQGLPLVWQAQTDAVGIQSNYLPQLHLALVNDEPVPETAASWAAANYLLQELGWQRLGRFIADLGRSDLDAALSCALQMDAAAFTVAWQTDWENRLTAVQNNLDNLLANRTAAILAQNETAFLRTVDANMPGLSSAQRRWLADLDTHPADNFAQTGRPLALLDDGGVLAQITLDYQLTGRGPSTALVTILCTPTSGGYLWAGKRLHELPGDTVVVRYPDGAAELAQALQIKATDWYTQLATLLEIAPTVPLQIELYDEPEDFRAAIALPYPPADWAAAWTEPGQAIKLKLFPNDAAEAYDTRLIRQISRQLLHRAGVNEEWLLNGLSAYLSREFDGGAT